MLIEATQLHQVLLARLTATIGWPPGHPHPPTRRHPPIRRAPQLAALLDTMATHHPSLRTRELALLASEARVALERRDAWPDPTLGVSYGHEAAPGPDPEANIWMLSLTVPIPLARRNQGEIAQAEAQRRVADRQRAETLAQLRGDLTQAATALNAAADRVELYATRVMPRLEQNLNLLQRAYELGEVDVHQVSQTRQRLLDATRRYIDARVAYYDTAATLEGLIGTELWTATPEASP